jgi:hypothetical protein
MKNRILNILCFVVMCGTVGVLPMLQAPTVRASSCGSCSGGPFTEYEIAACWDCVSDCEREASSDEFFCLSDCRRDFEDCKADCVDDDCDCSGELDDCRVDCYLDYGRDMRACNAKEDVCVCMENNQEL